MRHSAEFYAKIPGIKRNKQGKLYVSNPALYEEMVKSKAQDELTFNAVIMIEVLCENLSKKLPYNNPDDREDCISGGIMDCLKYWRSFDPEKGTNPFAYFTSVCTNGISKTWRALGKMSFPDSIMCSLDNSNIHTL